MNKTAGIHTDGIERRIVGIRETTGGTTDEGMTATGKTMTVTEGASLCLPGATLIGNGTDMTETGTVGLQSKFPNHLWEVSQTGNRLLQVRP